MPNAAANSYFVSPATQPVPQQQHATGSLQHTQARIHNRLSIDTSRTIKTQQIFLLIHNQDRYPTLETRSDPPPLLPSTTTRFQLNRWLRQRQQPTGINRLMSAT